MISDAIIRTITRWLPTLDEARLREVEDFVLAKAIEQQDDSAPTRADVSHGTPQAGGGTFSICAKCGAHGASEAAARCWLTECDLRARAPISSSPSHPSNGSQRVGGGTVREWYEAERGELQRMLAREDLCILERTGFEHRLRETEEWLAHRCLVMAVPVDDRLDSGLRELAAATPQVAAPGVADDHTLWSAEMVDGRFDGSDE